MRNLSCVSHVSVLIHMTRKRLRSMACHKCHRCHTYVPLKYARTRTHMYKFQKHTYDT